MKKLIVFIFLCNMLHIYGQAPYGNEWIDYSKPHFKVVVTQDGVYRIPYNTLAAAIPGLAGINPAEFALFNNGKQVPIYITWTGTPVTKDYIEFYGTKSNGEIDSKLYLKPDDNLNPYRSFTSDTSIYFLTFRNGVNKRLINTPNDLTALPPKENWFYHTTLVSYSNLYHLGKRIYFGKDYITHPGYDQGEGYGNAPFFPPFSASINTPFINFASGATCNLKFSLLSYNPANNKLNFTINSNFIKDSSFVGSFIYNFNIPFTVNYLTTNNTFGLTSGISLALGYGIGYFALTYPRDFNFGNQANFYFPIKNNNFKQYIEILGFTTNTSNPILLDINNGLRIVGTAPGSGNPLKFGLPVVAFDRQCYLYNENTFFTVTSMPGKTFFNFSSAANQGDYILVYNRKLTNDGKGNNKVLDYKNYRESLAGGGYKVALADIEELADQFAYGIPKHPLGLKKFLQFAMGTWTTKPKMTFLLGKGLGQDRNKSAANYPLDLISPYGQPPSDIMYGTYDTSFMPFMPIGRLGAENTDIIDIYLNKVKEYEAEYSRVGDPYQTIDRKEYTKWAIHLGGGTGPDQQGQYKFALQTFASKFRSPLIGGNVLSVFKDNSDIQQDLTTEQLRRKINKGTSLITFFGHSASTVFDISIDEPELFNNAGKYFFFLANGCNSGYIFDVASNTSYSDRFIKLPNKGSIGFLATGNFSFDDALIEYCKNFYNVLGNDQYAKTYGEICLGASREVLNVNGANILNQYNATSLEYIYQGDPAIRPNFYNKPDYVVEPSNISFNPTIVNTSMDSFDLNVKVVNLGKAIQDSIMVSVTRNVSGVQYFYQVKMKAPYYIDSTVIKMPVLYGQTGVGINKFDIAVETENKFDELSETNNFLNNQISTFITSDEVYPVYPYDFSIVNNNQIILKASTSDVFAPSKTYLFEIDTSEAFNTGFKISGEVISKGGTIQWKPNATYTDSIEYYWRVAPKASSPKWHVSSFIYLSNTPVGWNSSHYYQYLKSTFANIQLNSNSSFQYINNLKTIVIRTTGDPPTSNQGYGIEWEMNNARQQAFREQSINCGLNFVWIDGTTGLPKECTETTGIPFASYGSITSGGLAPTKYGFVFPDTGRTPANHTTRPNQPWSLVISDFLSNIPIGDYVLCYTLKKPDYKKWDVQLKQDLIALGVSQVPILAAQGPKAPFIFAVRKGDPSFTTIQTIGTSFSGTTDTSFGITGVWKEGFIQFPVIGPAKKWTSMHWRGLTVDNLNFDQNEMRVYGVTSDEKEIYLGKITARDSAIDQINAAQYPYLKVQFYTKDDTNRTPSQLKYLRVHYQPYPELGINPLLHYVFKDKLADGERVNFEVAVENLSDIDLDTVWNKFDVQGGNSHQITFVRLDTIQAGKFAILKIQDTTLPVAGKNTLLLEVNPLGSLYTNEQSHFNNYASVQFNVDRDVVNPLLDVTFDGEHIMNRDVVSPNPKIIIRLKDDNNYLLLKDTGVLAVSVKYPDGHIENFSYSDPRLKFTPAIEGDKVNQATIELNATFRDSIHELMVIDRDMSGNRSGNRKSFDYKVAFEVVTKQTITRILNYPNPFTTRTQFIFTLTGSKVPDQIKIQIMTITGKVVKEIFKDELGPLKIGVNKTSYWWDGTDMFGDKLANGVYLYRVVVKDNQQDVEIRNINNNIEKAFKGNMGKMVILR